jgi:hypothetical protein
MENWKKILLRAAGFGVGFAIIAVLALGVLMWQGNRAQKPKPWDPKAITATYDYVGVEGERNAALFVYILDNSTDMDYHVTDGTNIHLAGTLADTKALSFEGPDWLKIDYPIYIPAHSRIRFSIHVPMYFLESPVENASDDAKYDYYTRLDQFIVAGAGNLDGFVLLDDSTRYKITFPNGWAERAKKPMRVKNVVSSK